MSVTRNRLLFVLLPLLLAVGLSLMLPSSVSSRNGGGNVRIEANAEAVSVAESTVTLLGVTAHIDARTAFREDDKEGKEPFTLADIRCWRSPGNPCLSRCPGSGSRAPSEREMPESEVSLQGPVTSVDNPTLVILGVEIRTQPGTEFEAASGNDLMASTQFFAAVSPGTLVKVKGALQQRSVSRLAKSSWYNHRSARVSS